MSNRISSPRDFPKWFKLGSYSQLKQLNAAQWLEQLSIRKFCLDYLAGTIEKTPKNDTFFNIIIELTRTLSVASLNHPALPPIDHRVLPLHVKAFPAVAYRLAVKPMSVGSFEKFTSYFSGRWSKLQMFIADKYNHRENIQQAEREYFAHLRRLRNLPLRWLDKSHKHSTTIFEIDFTYPDNVIIDHFKTMLAEHRKDHPVKLVKEFKPSFGNYIDYNIIPYIDLLIWSKQEDLLITYKAYADGLFPDGDGDEDKIRKTVKSTVQQLMNDGYLDQLSSFAANELMSR